MQSEFGAGYVILLFIGVREFTFGFVYFLFHFLSYYEKYMPDI